MQMPVPFTARPLSMLFCLAAHGMAKFFMPWVAAEALRYDLGPWPRTAITRIAPGVFIVGGPDLTDPRDCLCYLVQGIRSPLIGGLRRGTQRGPHSGAGHRGRRRAPHPFGAHPCPHRSRGRRGRAQAPGRLPGHDPRRGRSGAGTDGDPLRSAANWYGLKLEAVHARPALIEDGDELGSGRRDRCCGWSTRRATRRARWPCSAPAAEPGCCFGQDIHGPFSPAFGSDLGDWRRVHAAAFGAQGRCSGRGPLRRIPSGPGS
jgi:hypothetical protein